MATTANGTSTPPAAAITDLQPTTTSASTDTSANKRKREDDPEPRELQHGSASPAGKQIQRDIVELLQQHDTDPSFLNYEFNDAPSSSEPSQKKARLSDPTDQTTIFAKLSSGTYSTLARLKVDAARVSKDIEATLRGKTRDGEAKDGGRLLVEDLKQIQRAKSFEELVREIVDKESQNDAKQQPNGVAKEEPSSLVNGHVADASAGASGRGGTVLTLFGNAPTPKQLFSSMQNAAPGKSDTMIKSELPVEEMSLPNGLTVTKIMPAPLDETKKGPTFDEVFAPPYNLPALHPPKSHKRSSTRDNTVLWEFRDSVNRGSKKGGYTVQSMATGEWLGYGGVDAAGDGLAKDKRKQRDRALSSGESMKDPPSQGTFEEQQAREEEALFRRAYSSFAPSHDDAKAVIPAEMKSMVWWHKVGERRFDERFAIDPALVDEQPANERALLPSADEQTREEDFDEAIKELDDNLDEDMADVKPVTEKTDIDRVLHDISQLLETLASYQRVRNATLTSSTSVSRTPISPSPVLLARNGTPEEPAKNEIATYESLQRELAYLVLKLPPYAVAKLDGDQLAELGVSKLIKIQTKDVRGIMEEDQVARLAKHNVVATAAGIATLTRSSSSTSGQHYSTTAQRTPAIGQAANTRYGQSSQYTARTPATQPQYQRSTSNQSTYGTPSATAPRPGYGQQPNQYTRPGAPQQQSYAQSSSNAPQYYSQQRPTTQQTPSSYYGGSSSNQQYQPTPTTNTTSAAQPRQPSYTQPPPPPAPPTFQSRSHVAAANAVAYQTNMSGQQQQQNRTASPANVQPRPVYPAAVTATAMAQGQYAPPTSSSGRGTPVYASGPQTPVNGLGSGFQRPASAVPGQAQLAPRAGSGTPGVG